METPPSPVTELLSAYRHGQQDVLDELLPHVYDDLHRLAHLHLRRERAGHTLDTTALVHESYLNLVGRRAGAWDSRAHFLAVASKAMRHILVDHARRRNAQKRGGDQHRVTLEAQFIPHESPVLDVLTLDQALTWLAEHDERMARVVECRFFGGMTMEETAQALGIGKRTAERAWRRARAYLYQYLQAEPTS